MSNFVGTFDQLFLGILLCGFHRRYISTSSIPWIYLEYWQTLYANIELCLTNSKDHYLSDLWAYHNDKLTIAMVTSLRIWSQKTQTKALQMQNVSDQTHGKFCSEHKRQNVFVLGLKSSYEACSLARRKVASSSFLRSPSDGVSSWHRSKQAWPRSDRTQQCWLTQLQTAIAFLFLNDFSKTKKSTFR